MAVYNKTRFGLFLGLMIVGMFVASILGARYAQSDSLICNLAVNDYQEPNIVIFTEVPREDAKVGDVVYASSVGVVRFQGGGQVILDNCPFFITDKVSGKAANAGLRAFQKILQSGLE